MVLAACMPYIRVMILLEVNVDKAVAQLRQQFAHMGTTEFNRRIAAVLNETLRGARTEASRSIRDRYPGIKLNTIRGSQTERKASASLLTAVLTTKGRPLPINQLGGRQTRQGVSFNLTGKRDLIQRAFIKALGGNTFALARGKYTAPGNSGFSFGKPRNPIDVVRSISVPGSMMTKAVSTSMENRIGGDFEAKASRIITNFMAGRGQ